MNGDWVEAILTRNLASKTQSWRRRKMVMDCPLLVKCHIPELAAGGEELYLNVHTYLGWSFHHVEGEGRCGGRELFIVQVSQTLVVPPEI